MSFKVFKTDVTEKASSLFSMLNDAIFYGDEYIEATSAIDIVHYNNFIIKKGTLIKVRFSHYGLNFVEAVKGSFLNKKGQEIQINEKNTLIFSSYAPFWYPVKKTKIKNKNHLKIIRKDSYE